MSNSQHYEIFGLATNCHRVKWQGPLENSRPADDVEQLVLELYHNDSARTDQHLQLDLSECPSVNTRGITFLIYLRRRLLELGVPWSIHNAPPMLQRMLEILNLETAFERSSGHTAGPMGSGNSVEAAASERHPEPNLGQDSGRNESPEDEPQEYIEISRNS